MCKGEDRMTIGDRIRNMSDEKISDFIEKARRNTSKYYDYLEQQICYQCRYYSREKNNCGILPNSFGGEEQFQRKCPCIVDFKGEIIKWLQRSIDNE